MNSIVNTCKTLLSLVLLVIVASCSHQSSFEDTIPSVESPKSSFGPTDMTISLDYPRGYNRQKFQLDYGPALGLTLVYSCPSNPDRELWVVDYHKEEDFINLLNSLFEHVGPKTQSNGNGGYQAYVKYNSSSGGGSSGSNATNSSDPGEDLWYDPVFIMYDGSCD